MYKRLFLQCRSVVAGDVTDILTPTSPNKSVSSPLSKVGTVQLEVFMNGNSALKVPKTEIA